MRKGMVSLYDAPNAIGVITSNTTFFQVDVFSLDKIGSRRTITINGTVIGEYFGASLATGDFDGDGRDDLAVGAPHWGEVDFGRVYIYHSENHVSNIL